MNNYTEVDDIVVTEGVKSPIGKLKNDLKRIKDEKPKEYSDNQEIKEFVDKNYDLIDKASKILEKEPAELRKKEIKDGAIMVLSMLTGFAVMCGTMEAVAVTTVIAGAAFYLFTGLIVPLIISITTYIRTNDDKEAYNDLMKIRTALVKIKDKKNLPDKYKKKILDLLSSIDDAEEEISARMKVHKESVDNTKLKVYESYAESVISKDECDYLIEVMKED